MKNLIILFFSIILFSSCASIVSMSTYPIGIISNPEEANVIVKKRNGDVIYSGKTPAYVKLNASGGYFVPAKYFVTFEKEGYQSITAPINFMVDGWYWGNIFFGGPLGMLIIDPLTGAMYKPRYNTLNTDLSPLK